MQIVIRLIGLFLSGISAIVSAKFILNGLGPNQFVIYAFAVNIPNLMPFANLGVSTSLLNNSSKRSFAKSGKFTYEQIVLQSFIILVISASFIFALSLSFSLTGLFEAQLNLGPYRNSLIILPILALVTVALPLSIGFFILQAEKRSTEALAIGYITPIVSLIGAFFASEYDGIRNYWGLWLPTLGYLLACIIAFHRSKAISKLKLSSLTRIKLFNPDLTKYILISGFPSLVLNSTILISIHLPRIVLLHFGFANEAISYSLFILFLFPLYNLISTYSLWASPFLRDISQAAERRLFIRNSISSALPFLFAICIFLIALTFFRSPKFLYEFLPMPSVAVMSFIFPLTILQCVMVFYYTSVVSYAGMKMMSTWILILSVFLNSLNYFCIESGNAFLIYPIMTGYAIIAAFVSFKYFGKESL
jgi:hypothetical protein